MASKLIYDKNGWLFENPQGNIVHDTGFELKRIYDFCNRNVRLCPQQLFDALNIFFAQRWLASTEICSGFDGASFIQLFFKAVYSTSVDREVFSDLSCIVCFLQCLNQKFSCFIVQHLNRLFDLILHLLSSCHFISWN